MINSLDLTSKLAIDTKSIDDLHLLSKQDSKKALQEAAKQFEALFLQMLIKSMRDATLKSGLTDTQQTQFYTEMYDQQLAQTMSAKGIGLADIMVEQLTRTYNTPEHSEPFAGIKEDPALNSSINNSNTAPATNQSHQFGATAHTPFTIPKTEDAITSPSIPMSDKSRQLWTVNHAATQIAESVKTAALEEKYPNKNISNSMTSTASNKTTDFISTLMPHANQASESTGIPARFMLAQAALESGWGKHEIRHPDNSPSYNLFGIKAGSHWKGETVETVTTEYINGVPQKMVEKFRAYQSYEEGFRDYARLLSNNPRYAEVLNTKNAADFANGLQQAGYATDPRYADKLLRILNNSILYNQKAI
ncbi:flagellar assembly peptidoglycan hydrolase FlgJ [Nitrosomonas sp.]|uniref:flagellar assembly peptidoglycan hydrolase FlgJ n=1 Tax=Nitrosomonas sp. TaxID=42353 RepID=UPI00207E5CEB|nr:flagellar assembly peptidoglycan hydrolase FlgJ [Nitrosomonas sp.]GJL75509.1 MAG: flagellar rod assembly protein FlgJ [Nitrosomonas sp.]